MEKQSLTLPGWMLCRTRVFGGGVFTLLGLVILTVCLSRTFSGEPGALFLLIYGLPSLFWGTWSILPLFIKFHFVPESIALTLGEKTIRRIPLKKLGMIFAMEWYFKGPVRMAGISLLSPEEITALRENKLKRGYFTKDELAFRKRKSGWEQVFRAEYLYSRAQWDSLKPWKRDILWLEWDSDLLAVLRQLYPQVPYERLERKDNLGVSDVWTDGNRLEFSRARGADPKTEIAAAVGLLAVLGGFWVILLVFRLWAFVPALVFLCLLIALTLVVCWGESDLFCLSEQGIRILRGRRELAAIPAEDIQAILRCDRVDTFGTAPSDDRCLVVALCGPQELLQREIHSMCRTGQQRQLLTYICNVPGWEQRALARYCTRWWKKSAVKDPDLYIMAWNPGREQVLRELYPHAEFLDVSFEQFTRF